ncbi:MAG: hypothetical protein ABR559_04550 [Gemmatimonadota bacterium]
MGQDERNGQQLPFEGLHVYQRAQDAWGIALEAAQGEAPDGMGAVLEGELRAAALGIARASALSRENGSFASELERARGALHAGAAVLEQLERRGTPGDARLRPLLVDGSRMLGALVRSLSPRDEVLVGEAVV